ncbi:MAG: hypothetical protein H6742_07770 [Alphaproteobacteria bacterium]|nr:hypothetical protein [Alphaproteobacteria bacterium]
MWILLASSVALADPLLALPLERLQALHLPPEVLAAADDPAAAPPRLEPVSFGTVQSGLSRQVPGGIAFAFVGRDAAEAQAWLALQRSRQRAAPVAVEQPAEGVDEAWIRGTDFSLLRDDNVGIMVQGTEDAVEESALVRALLEPMPGAWPDPPALSRDADGFLVVDAPWAVHVTWRGGVLGDPPGLRFRSAPNRVTAWDRWGRAVVWTATPPVPVPAVVPAAPTP